MSLKVLFMVRVIRNTVLTKHLNGIRSFSNGARSRGFLDASKQKQYEVDTAKTALNAPLDYLMQDLRTAHNASIVLNLVGQHHRIMNSKQCIQALQSIFELQKYGHSSLSLNQILKHPNFEKLCKLLKSQSRYIDENETIQALKVLSYIGVSSDSTIVQVLLQIIRGYINDLSLSHIIFTDFLLNQFKHTPLIQGLLIALPIVFEIQLPTKMNRDLTHLADYLHYASKNNVSEKTIELLTREILESICREKLDFQIAKSIVWSLCDLRTDANIETLMHTAINCINENFNNFNYTDVQTTLTKLVANYSLKRHFFYNERFFDLCAHSIVDKDMGFEKAYFTLEKLVKLYHANDRLIDYICVKFQEDPSLIGSKYSRFYSNLILGLALTDHRPTNFSYIQRMIEETDCLEFKKQKGLIWSRLAASLCALNVTKREVLEIVFEKDFLNINLQHKHPNDINNLLVINQSVRTFHTQYSELLPSQKIVDEMVQLIRPEDYPLTGALKRALGGDEYVLNGVNTHLGHHIDHVVAFRKGGYPIAFSQPQVDYLEELNLPAESQVVAIVLLRWNSFTNNHRLKGTTGLSLQVLEANNVASVTIDLSVFEQLLDRERIPYLMRCIREKTKDLSLLADEGVH